MYLPFTCILCPWYRCLDCRRYCGKKKEERLPEKTKKISASFQQTGNCCPGHLYFMCRHIYIRFYPSYRRTIFRYAAVVAPIESCGTCHQEIQGITTYGFKRPVPFISGYRNRKIFLKFKLIPPSAFESTIKYKIGINLF